MDLISKNDVNTLTDQENEVSVSLFMPIQQEPDKYQENVIRLKNLQKRLKEKLANSEVEDDAVFLEPLKAMNDNGRISLEHPGMALFMTKNGTHQFGLPNPVDEQITVDNRFDLKPLLPLVEQNGRFHILTLSQQDAHLYEATRDSIKEITPDELPQGIDEALPYEDPEKRQQFHTSTQSPQAPGSQPAAFHAHDPSEEKKSFIRRYFQEIDAVLDKIYPRDIPLVLVGVDYLHPIYEEANSHPMLMDEGVHGNPDSYNEEEIHKKGWHIAQSYFIQKEKDALERYNISKGTDQFSNDWKEVVAAAAYGRVDTLFAAEDSEIWGTFDRETGQVEESADEGRGEELVNFTIHETLKNSGKVFVMPSAKVPDKTSLAAILRY